MTVSVNSQRGRGGGGGGGGGRGQWGKEALPNGQRRRQNQGGSEGDQWARNKVRGFFGLWLIMRMYISFCSVHFIVLT